MHKLLLTIQPYSNLNLIENRTQIEVFSAAPRTLKAAFVALSFNKEVTSKTEPCLNSSVWTRRFHMKTKKTDLPEHADLIAQSNGSRWIFEYIRPFTNTLFY